MIRSEQAALRAASWLVLVVLVLGVGWLWWTAEKAPDFRVGRRVPLRPETFVEWVPRMGLAGEVRDAWALPAGRRMRVPVQVPGADPVLRFHEGYLRGLPELSVTVVFSSGRREEIFRAEGSREQWRVHRVPLPVRPGEAIDIEFAAHDGRGRPRLGVVLLSHPVLETEGRVVDETEVVTDVRVVAADLLASYDAERRAAPADTESERAGLPGPRCLPLPPGRPVFMDLPPAGEGARLEVVVRLAPRPDVDIDPSAEPLTLRLRAGDTTVADMTLDLADGVAVDRLLTVDLPLRTVADTEIGWERSGGAGVFVGLREVWITEPRTVWRRPFQPGVSRNTVLVVVDSLRPDRLGSYGYASGHTPNLDALAARGVRYENAYAPSSWFLPNLATLLLGTSPVSHGVGLGEGRVPSPRLLTLAEAAAVSGRVTAAFTSNIWVSDAAGLRRGQQLHEVRATPAAMMVEMAVDWLTEVQDFEWFLTLHLADPSHPHEPEEPDLAHVARRPPEELVERLRGLDSRPGLAEMMANELGPLYDAEVAGVDRALGRLLDWLEASGLAADTSIVVVGSQGTEFFEHGGRLVGQSLHDEVVRVPLIVAGAGVPEAWVESEPVQLVDVTRLLSTLSGVADEGQVRGRLPPPFGPELAEPPLSYALLRPFRGITRHDLEAVRHGPWLLLVDRAGDRRALFDLASDPGARIDLLSRPEPRGADLRRASALETAYRQWYRAGMLSAAARPLMEVP